MIAALIIWAYIIVFAYIFGWTCIDRTRRFFQLTKDTSSVSVPIIIIAGLCGITVFASVLSLFINLGWLAQAIFFALGIFLAWRMWKKHATFRSIRLAEVSGLLIILFLLIFLGILENGTHGVSNPDTGIYHAQAIRWMETYPAVPGLGNLHSRLAYDSSWLVLNAFFSFSFLRLGSFHVLPGVFILIAMAYFIGGGKELIAGRISIAGIFKVLLIPLTFYTIGSQISAPGTDFPADLLMWVTVALMLDSFEGLRKDEEKSVAIEEILVFIFSIVLITIKLSVPAVLLLAAYVFVRQFRKNKIGSIRLLVLAAIILIPWFARNLVLSGYWVYPVPAIVQLSPDWDWKIPLSNVAHEARSIIAWARIPRVDTEQVLSMPLGNWLREWFANQSPNRKILVILSVFSPITYATSAWLGLRRTKALGYYSIIYFSSFIGVITWLFLAPDIRFGYAVLVPTLLLSAIPILFWILNKTALHRIATSILIFAIILFQASVLIESFDSRTIASRILLPIGYNSLATLPCDIHGKQLMCAEYYNECWYDPFPCIPPGSADSRVEMRGSSFRDGFRYIPAQ